MRPLIVFALICFGPSAPAFANQAEVCYSSAVPAGQSDKLTGSTPLDCPVAGRHTLADLAQGGWTVASVQPVVVDYRVDPATHSPESATSWMVVVQRGAK